MLGSREEIEQYIIACCLTDKALFGYTQSRVAAEHFLGYRLAWQSLVGGDREKALQVVGDSLPETDSGKLAEAIKQLKIYRSLDKLKVLNQNALRGLNNGAWKVPEEFLRRFVRAAQSLEVPSGIEESVMSSPEWLEKGYEKLAEEKDRPDYYQLGLPTLTQAILPQKGHLVIVAAETGRGKTALALNIAANLGMRQKVPTLYVNTEMAWWEMAYRLYSLLGAGDLSQLRLGKADLNEVQGIRDAFGDSKLFITDALPWAEVNEILALAREYSTRYGVEILVLDYIQRLESGSRDLEHWEVFLQAARQLKSLAQQQNMLVFMVAQLNDGKQLAGSKGMAREADVVLIMEEARDPEAFETHILTVAKSRHTQTGTKIPVMFSDGTLAVEEIGG